MNKDQLCQLRSRHAELAALAAKYVPKRWRGSFESAHAQDLPPRGAIKAKCQSCVGFDDVIDRVRGCTAFKCPLWCYRPYQKMTESSVDEMGDAE